MSAEPITTRDGLDALSAEDLYIWSDSVGSQVRYWNEADGWVHWPMQATVYPPQYPDGKRTPPSGQPHAGFLGGWRLFADALRHAMNDRSDYVAARGAR